MHWSHRSGFDAEKLVRSDWMDRGATVVAERLRTPFAEIDLLFRWKGQLWLIEVKTLSRVEFLSVRMSRRQKVRLCQAREWIQEHFRMETALIFAVVQGNGKILLFNLSEEDLR